MMCFARCYTTLERVCLFSHVKQTFIFFHKRKIYLHVYRMNIVYIQRDVPYHQGLKQENQMDLFFSFPMT